MKALSEIRREIACLDSLLEPIAEQLVDINDSNWEARLAALDPLAQAGVKAQAQDLISEVLVRYVDGTESEREELREMFQEYSSFAWAATPHEAPTTRNGLQDHLVLLSIQDQGKDPRDVLMAIDDLIATAAKCGVDIQPLLSEVAKISSAWSRYGMGSMKEILLTRRPTE